MILRDPQKILYLSRPTCIEEWKQLPEQAVGSGAERSLGSRSGSGSRPFRRNGGGPIGLVEEAGFDKNTQSEGRSVENIRKLLQ
jgi:hypothetical protein